MKKVRELTDNKRLKEIASNVATRYGYTDVSAEFTPFRDFKVKWTRAFEWISFEISDYLEGAPDDALESLFVTVFERIKGDVTKPYGDPLVTYLTSEEFRNSNRDLFLDRQQFTEGGESITDAVGIIAEKGLYPEELSKDLFIGTFQSDRQSIPRTSALFRAIAIPSSMENLDTMELARNIYHEICVVQAGFPKSDRSSEIVEQLFARWEGTA